MNGALNLHPKVAASLIASYLATIGVYALHQWAHTDLPDYVSVAVVGVLTLVVGWLAPNATTETTSLTPILATTEAPPAE